MSNMKLWLVNLLVALPNLIVNAKAAEELNCPPSTSATTPLKLRNALLCNYDSRIRPVVDRKNGSWVSFRIMLKYFTYDVTTSTLSLDAWMTVNWKDDHLTWNPDDYDAIKSIHLEAAEIWTPDLSIYNKADQSEDPSVLGAARCTLTNKGLVLCVPSVHIDALCVPDLSRYPFDDQECTLRMGSWVHTGEELDIKMLGDVINTDELVPNGEWEIAGHKAKKHPGRYKCCPNDTYPSIEVDFKLKRLAGAHAASVIIPTIVVVMMTFAALSMLPTERDRLILCYTNLLAQFMHVQYLSWQVPLKGDQVPLLLIYARDSLLLGAFAIVFTLIFRSMMLKKTTAPSWISGIVSVLIGCRPGQIILLNDYSVRGVASAKMEDDGVTIVNSESNVNSQDWELFGKILDKLLFLSYIMAYFVMTIAFIP